MEVGATRSGVLAMAGNERKTPPPTTTISTIAVQSGATKLVIALLQSDEWFQLKILDAQPQLTKLGETLTEAKELLKAHEEVLRQLESKQSPVEELLRQADQLISTQRPRAEVYAAMAESLGLAWKDVNNHLEERKQILQMNVNYKREEQNCLQKIEQLELTCLDAPVPVEIEAVKQLLTKLHSSKRAMLESLMVTLQEGKQLLEKFKKIAKEGTLDSRPDNIKANAERAVSKVEHWLENLHDKRKLIEVIWQTRKTQIEQCLALALLATELLDVENILKSRKELLLRSRDRLGDSKAEARNLLEELTRILAEAKDLQDRTLKITNSTEKLVSSGHFAGEQAISQSYAVLNDCAEYLDNIDKRGEILDKSVSFYDAADTAFGKFKTIQKRLTSADLSSSSTALSELHSELVSAVEESTEPAISIGNELLDIVGHNAPGAEGVRNTLNELRSQRINLEGICTAKREQKLQVSQSINIFLEKYNEILSWLITTVEAFLQGHQDMGSALPISRDYLNVHIQLLNELRVKETELKSFLSTVPGIISQLDGEERSDLQDKVTSLQDHWKMLKSQLEKRIDLARTYVKFHTDAVDLTNRYDLIEDDFKKRWSATEEDIRQMEEKRHSAEQSCTELSQLGKNFLEDAGKVMDQYLDVKRASLCIETILEKFFERDLAVSKSWRAWQSSINAKIEVKNYWARNMANCKRTLDWITQFQPQLYPILLEDYDTCKDVIAELERKEMIVIPEMKKAVQEIESRIKEAEDLTRKGEAPPEENEKVLINLITLQKELQATLTEYQILVQMLKSFFENLSEVEKTIQNISHQNQVTHLSNSVQEVESVIKEHEAYCQAVAELFRFTKNESDSIIKKINSQEPENIKQTDIDKIQQYLTRKQKEFERESTEKKLQLEQHRQLCQFDEDLKEINSTLSDLNDQLISIRGQYGESLAAAKATSQAFVFFEKTIELLEQRIKTFIESGEELLNTEHSSSIHIEKELKKTKDKWDDFYKQVQESRRLIDLSIKYFTLVEEAEDWFKEGSKLLVTIARKTTSVRKPEEATELLDEVAVFLKPGELRQDERIKKIGELASQLFGEEGVKHMNPVLTENREMIDSFTLISQELNTLALNLKQSEEERDRLKLEQKEIDANLSAVKAEALAAKAAAAAAEEARKAAELAAKVLRESTYTTRIEKIEIEKVISSVESPKAPSPPKKLKTGDVAPEFVIPLRDATVREGEKFRFECRVTGNPTPDILWLKEGIPVENNPDYLTQFDTKEGICTLDIEETFAEDTAKFTCKAINPAGTAETNALLTVAETVVEEILTPPNFTESLKPGTCKEGGTYELTCLVEGYPLPTVSWFKGQTCVDNSPDYVITYNNGEAKLRFDQVFLEDQSQYTCKATNSVGNDETTAYFTVEPLEPTAAPEVITPLSNVMARAGQKIRLECEVHGIPQPQISWHRDGRPVKTNHDIMTAYEDGMASLTITETFPKDGGVYTMTARNIVGEAISTCNVTVKGLLPNETSDSEMASDAEPMKPSIQLTLKDQSVFEGKTVLLECVIVGQPEPEVIWYHDGEPVKESDDFLLLFQGDHCSLLIKDVYVEDAGEYKVVAINSVGEASSSCHLSVTPVKAEEELKEKVEIEEIQEQEGEQPKFTKLLTDMLADEGEKINLECCVAGEPKPDIKWYLNNQIIEITEKVQMDEDAEGNVTLTLLKVTPEDKGVYTVKASNAHGEAKCFAQLIVKEKPKTVEPQEEKRSPPIFIKKFDDVTAKENDEVEFECKVEGKPTPVVNWFLNNEKVSGENFRISSIEGVHKMVVAKVEKQNGGSVTCVAENEAGKAVYSSKLTVRDSSLHKEFKLVPFIEPIVNQETMETSAFSTKRHVVMESTTSTNRTVTSATGGEPRVEVHSFSSRDEKSLKQVDQQPVEEMQSHESKEFHQINNETPIRKEDSSLVVSTGGEIVGGVTKSNSLLMLGPKLTRKSTVPRFVTPVQGKIADQGSDVVLEGVIEGYPPPTVTWSKNGVDVESQDNKISISFELNHAKIKLFNVDVKDAGRYTCKAANSVGTASSMTDLVVKKTVFPPVLGKRLQAQTVPKGERAKLEVEVTGTPEPTVTWYKDDLPIKSSNLFRIINQGNSHILIIDKASDEHSGRYMVKATNAGGLTQSMADLIVCEFASKQDFSAVTNYHDKISSAAQLMPQVVEKHIDEGTELIKDKTVMESQEKEKHVSSDEPLSMTETTKTQKIIRVKLEREVSPGISLTTDEKLSQPEEKKEKIVTVHLPEEETTEDIDRTSIPKQSSLNFFKTKIRENEEEAKKTTETPKLKSEFISVAESDDIPPALDVFSKQSEIVSQLKTVQKQGEVKPQDFKPDAITRVQESYSIIREEKSTFSKCETVEKKTEKIEPIFKKPQSDLKLIMPSALYSQEKFVLTPEPPPEIGYIPKNEKVKVRDDITEKVKKLEEFHKVGSPVDAPSGGVRLLPIVFPKPEPQSDPEEKVVKKVEEKKIIETLPPLSWLADEPYSKEDKEVLQSTLSIAQSEKSSWIEREPQVPSSFSTTHSTLSVKEECRPTSPRPSAEGLAMEKLWASKKPYDDYKLFAEPETLKPGIYRPSSSLEPMRAASPRPSAEGVAMEKLWTPQKPIENRPASSLGFINRCSSPRPSQEGIAMDKIWAHKHKESSLKINWPPPQPKEEKQLPWTGGSSEARIWPPEQQATEVEREEIKIRSFQETDFPKPSYIQPLPRDAPVQHYIAESRLIRQTQSMDRQIFLSESSSASQHHYLIENGFIKPVKKMWPPSDLQAPSLVKQIDQSTTVQSEGKQSLIQPGPPPELGFAARPEMKSSFLETIEKDLKKDLFKTPSKTLPGTVSIIPPPTKAPMKKEYKRSSSLDSKPFERFPDLEPFPFKPDPPRPKPAKCPPPPTPTKFVKCNFAGSDYESDYDSRISIKWRPYESDGEEIRFRRVRPPSVTQPKRPQSTEPEPLPPSKFENPPEFQGPPRPVVDMTAFKTSTQSKKTFVEAKEAKKKFVKVKPISPPKLQPGSPPEFVHAPRTKPESPKIKPVKMAKPPESGYMADTDEPFVLQKFEKLTATKRTVFEGSVEKKLMESSSSAPSQLEPFPNKVESIKPTSRKAVSTALTPSKFIRTEYKESDYESDYDSRIPPVWNSEGQAYKPVRPNLTPSGRHTYSSTGRTPTPPTEFDIPPVIGSRPKFEPIAPETRLYSDNNQLIKPKPLTPKIARPDINLQPGPPPEIAYAPAYPKAVETSNVMSFQEDTETSRRVVNVQQTTRLISFGEKKEKSKFQETNYGDLHNKNSPFKKIKSVDTPKTNFCTQIREPDFIFQPGEPPELVYAQVPVSAATSYANKHIKDMTQTFKSKAQQFVSDVMTDTKKPDKPILKSSAQINQNGTTNANSYKEESRLLERGTKHIDPDTGLIYFKYDFGYEFGIVLPGEGGKKSVSGGTKPSIKPARRESIEFPVFHETTNKEETTRPKVYKHFKSVKWDPMSESEMSEAEEFHKKRAAFSAKEPQVTIPGSRWESTPSPLSISPMSSISPKCQRSTPLDPAASPTWMRSGTPTSTTPGLNQKSVVNPSNEPLKAPHFITPLRDIAVVSGQPARFECIVQAEPTPNILWMKDGRILDNNQFHEIQYKNGVCRLTILQAYPGRHSVKTIHLRQGEVAGVVIRWKNDTDGMNIWAATITTVPECVNE